MKSLVMLVAAVALPLSATAGEPEAGAAHPGLATLAWAQEATASPIPQPGTDDPLSPSDTSEPTDTEDVKKKAGSDEVTPPDRTSARQTLIASLTIFVLAIFVGFEVITKVPPTLHTPLMSGSNAISGITLVGALIVAGLNLGAGSLLGLIAVILATVNVVGGFLVTHRMLSMFKRK